VLDHHVADLLLRENVDGFLLADVDSLGVRRREVQESRWGKVVEEDDVRRFEQIASPASDELGIAGDGADEVDLAGHVLPSTGLP
jgi:hypothetical protein